MGKAIITILFGLMVASTSLRLNIHDKANQGVDTVSAEYRTEMARNVANSSANFALNALMWDIEAADVVNNANLCLNGNCSSLGTYSYFFERQAQDASLGNTEVRLTAIGNYEDVSDTVVILLTRPSFSRYAWFTNQEGNIWFYSGDTIRGPAHTNEYFRMAGEPTFYGKVTSHEYYNYPNQPYRRYDGSTNPHFYGGTEWGTPEIPLDTQIPQETIDAASSGGFTYNTRYVWLKFRANGTVKVCAKNSSSWPTSGEWTIENLDGTNGTFYINYPGALGRVRVWGTVNGRVTVATKEAIQIRDNLICADDPRTNPNSDDMIGLVSEKHIMVTNNSYLQDRTIQASIMTMNPTVSSTTNFWVKDYDDDEYGTLHIYGGIIQMGRGAVGTFSWWGRTGYIKDYEWDGRLKDLSPPNFPHVTVLRKIAWYD